MKHASSAPRAAKIAVTEDGLGLIGRFADELVREREQEAQGRKQAAQRSQSGLTSAVKNIFRPPAALAPARLGSKAWGPGGSPRPKPARQAGLQPAAQTERQPGERRFVAPRSPRPDCASPPQTPQKRDNALKVEARLRLHQQSYSRTLASVRRRAQQAQERRPDPDGFARVFEQVRAALREEKERLRLQRQPEKSYAPAESLALRASFGSPGERRRWRVDAPGMRSATEISLINKSKLNSSGSQVLPHLAHSPRSVL